jgi:ribosome-associated protein
VKHIDEIKRDILEILAEKKALEVVEIAVTGNQNALTDSRIIASGTSSRHVQSVAENLYKMLKDRKQKPRIEGKASSGWVIVEASGIEVHLFRPELRDYYDLEHLDHVLQ